MTVKERLHQVVDQLPDEVAVELEHYAGYLQGLREREEWGQFSLHQLAQRYDADEVEYEVYDARAQ